ncbi:MAG: conjugal transfer protein TraR [Firmicutes bacterium]|nr:conjugal transfer protein TraR [Bacillota bacterium]HXL04279.1 TraR/DksA C4-type zinc finger protein [Bacillota bacterium]
MDKETMQTYRARLLSEKSRLKQRIELLEGKGEGGIRQSMKDSIGELSLYDNHPADISSELFERGKDTKLCEDAKIILDRVNEAIDLIDTGKYGTCQNCGHDIESDRLDLIPYTRLCSKCQDNVQNTAPPKRDRPIEEEVLGIPFGDRVRNRKSPGIDGEDVWQDLERYGTANGPQDLVGILSGEEVFQGGGEQTRGAVEDVELIATKDYKVIPGGERSRPKRRRHRV